MALGFPDPISQTSEDAHWYAVWTAPRHEKRVAERIRERNLELFLPVYHSLRQWKKRPETIIELPLFPGYVFVHMNRASRGAVLATPGVHSIVGNGKQHIPIHDSEIDTLRRGLHLANPQPHAFIATGSKVVICRGTLAGLEGVLVRHKGTQRVVIAIESIMRAFSVEIDIADLRVKDPSIGNAIVPISGLFPAANTPEIWADETAGQPESLLSN